jgi:hypothetical protein
MKMSQLHKTQIDGKYAHRSTNYEYTNINETYYLFFFLCLDDNDSESDDSGDERLDEDPILENKILKHYGGVNRVRVTPQKDLQIAASWADTGKVHIWDLSPTMKSLDTKGYQIPQKSLKPIYTVESHSIEGFAMDWSGTVPGRCDIHLVSFISFLYIIYI